MSNIIMPVPEEILERILELVFFPSSQPSLSETRATHVLLVCKTFERIALPFLYSSLRLKTRGQADKLAATLAKRPALGECVRALYVESPACGTAFSVVVNAMDARICPLDVLDIKLDSTRDEELEQETFDQFCGALRRCPDAKALVVRKSGYLTHDKTVRAVADLASGVRMCSSVERVDLKYKPSPLPAALLSAASPGPHHFVCDPLAAALATLPRLKVVIAQLPAIWNPFLLEVSSNAALDRVELMDREEHLSEYDSGTVSTGLNFTSCEGRLPCRGRGRGMSDVAYASAPSISGRGTASLPQTHSRMRPSCPCSFDVTPEIESVPEPCDADVALPPSLFMTQAAKHPHLHALILAGRRHLFLARMQARAARVRADMAAGCVCAGARLMSSSLSQSQSDLLPPSPTAVTFGSRTRAHTVLPSASNPLRSGRS